MSLALAVLAEDISLIYELIFHDADVEERNDIGNGPLHAVAFTGNIEIAKVLVKAGANVNARGAKGRTPLHIASFYERCSKLVQFLLENQADPELKDDFGKTPRDYATPSCAIHLDAFLVDKWTSFLGLKENSEGEPTKLLKKKESSNKDAEALLLALDQLQAPPLEEPPKPTAPIKPMYVDETSFSNSSAVIESSGSIPISDGQVADINNQSTEIQNGFFVEIDGTQVFVPFSSEEEGELIHTEEEIPLEAHSRLVKLIVRISVNKAQMSTGRLGMLLEEDENSNFYVSKLKRRQIAYLSGVRVGDILLQINGQEVVGSIESLEDIVDKLSTRKDLVLTLERRAPRVLQRIHEENEIDWKICRNAPEVYDVIEFLRNPLPSMDKEQIMALIQSFQHAVSTFRKGEGGEMLEKAIREGLGSDKAETVDIVEQTAGLIHHAIRYMEGLEEGDDEEKFVVSDLLTEMFDS